LENQPVMANTLFLQSEVPDPYALYETMRNEGPVYWDEINRHWAIYSYDCCKEILSSDAVQVPVIDAKVKDGLNEYALLIAGQFARLSNGVSHEISRQVVTQLMQKINADSVGVIMKDLLKDISVPDGMDWVHSICRHLPIKTILSSFSFNKADSDFILGKMESLSELILPGKPTKQVLGINGFSKELYIIVEKHLLYSGSYLSCIRDLAVKHKAEVSGILSLFVSNIIGLFIQGYEATRGLLSNALLQILQNTDYGSWSVTDPGHLRKVVMEILRFDPPVHNTRRKAVKDFMVNKVQIKSKDAIFIMLAAANRDPGKFNQPDKFDAGRTNNHEHITFGSGIHSCVANHFSVSLTVDGLVYFLDRYKKVRLLNRDIQYEPLINLRLPRNIFISQG